MKTLKTSMFMAAALMVGVVGFAASANAATVHHTTHAKGQLFSKLDTNHNGVVSRKEFAAHYGKTRAEKNAFSRIDTNRNGSISRAELAAGKAQVHSLRHA